MDMQYSASLLTLTYKSLLSAAPCWLSQMRSDVNVSQLVLNVPTPLLASLSLSTLRRAQLTSVEQLEGRNWTRAQVRHRTGVTGVLEYRCCTQIVYMISSSGIIVYLFTYINIQENVI